jgi:hypothetical protein
MLASKLSRLTIIALALLVAAVAHGEQLDPADGEVIELRWNDLTSDRRRALEREAEALQRKLSSLTPQERKLYEDVALELAARDSLASGKTAEDMLPELQQVLERRPARDNPDAVALWRRARELRDEYAIPDERVRADLDERRVRLPGYVLPLQFEGSQVSEFLLVPFVGACIHTPPPPANQMVHVTASEPFDSEGLFAAVWVEGIMRVGRAEYELTLVDGTGAVAAGYRLEAARVTSYRDP